MPTPRPLRVTDVEFDFMILRLGRSIALPVLLSSAIELHQSQWGAVGLRK